MGLIIGFILGSIVTWVFVRWISRNGWYDILGQDAATALNAAKTVVSTAQKDIAAMQKPAVQAVAQAPTQPAAPATPPAAPVASATPPPATPGA